MPTARAKAKSDAPPRRDPFLPAPSFWKPKDYPRIGGYGAHGFDRGGTPYCLGEELATRLMRATPPGVTGSVEVIPDDGQYRIVVGLWHQRQQFIWRTHCDEWDVLDQFPILAAAWRAWVESEKGIF